MSSSTAAMSAKMDAEVRRTISVKRAARRDHKEAVAALPPWLKGDTSTLPKRPPTKGQVTT